MTWAIYQQQVTLEETMNNDLKLEQIKKVTTLHHVYDWWFQEFHHLSGFSKSAETSKFWWEK